MRDNIPSAGNRPIEAPRAETGDRFFREPLPLPKLEFGRLLFHLGHVQLETVFTCFLIALILNHIPAEYLALVFPQNLVPFVVAGAITYFLYFLFLVGEPERGWVVALNRLVPGAALLLYARHDLLYLGLSIALAAFVSHAVVDHNLKWRTALQPFCKRTKELHGEWSGAFQLRFMPLVKRVFRGDRNVTEIELYTLTTVAAPVGVVIIGFVLDSVLYRLIGLTARPLVVLCQAMYLLLVPNALARFFGKREMDIVALGKALTRGLHSYAFYNEAGAESPGIWQSPSGSASRRLIRAHLTFSVVISAVLSFSNFMAIREDQSMPATFSLTRALKAFDRFFRVDKKRDTLPRYLADDEESVPFLSQERKKTYLARRSPVIAAEPAWEEVVEEESASFPSPRAPGVWVIGAFEEVLTGRRFASLFELCFSAVLCVVAPPLFAITAVFPASRVLYVLEKEFPDETTSDEAKPRRLEEEG